MRRVMVLVVSAMVASSLPGVIGLPRAGAVSSVTDPATLVNAPSADVGGRYTQADSSLAVLGTNVVAAFTDSGSSAPPPITHFTGWARSTNSGKSFTDMGTLPGSAMGDGGHPSLAVNAAEGFIYLSTVGQTLKYQVPVFRSADGGATWGTPVNAAPGYASGVVGNQAIAVDNFAGACQGNVYLGYQSQAAPAGMKLSRSTDDGVTWTPNQGVVVSNFDLGGDPSIVIGPDHAVYFFWLSNVGNVVTMRRSTDCGVTFGDPVVVADLAVTAPQGDLGLEGGVASNSYPRAVVDPVTGVLYLAVNDKGAGTDKADVYYTSSTNSGGTWAPLQDLTGGMAGSQWSPAIAFSKTGKAVMVSFDDSYHNTQGLLVVRRYDRLGTASAGALTLAPAFPTSPEFPIVVGMDSSVGSSYMGTYDAIAPLGTGFINTWTDTRDQIPGLDGPDIRYERVPAVGKADLAVTLTGPATANYRTPVTITATVSDLSTTKAADVVYLQLNPDAGLLPSNPTTSGGACYFTDVPLAVTCHVARLSPGQSRTVKLTVAGFTLGTHHTTATVGSSLPDPAVANNTAQLTTTVLSPFITDKPSLVNDPNQDATASDAQSGPAAAAIRNTIVAAYEDTGSPGNHRVGWSRSTDGGATFTDMGALPDSTAGDAGRPAVVADPSDGSFYIAAPTASGTDTQVFRSTDGGATFAAPVAIGPEPGGLLRGLLSMAVDTTAGPCAGTIYLVARTQASATSDYGHVLFASTDHGATWTRRISTTSDGPYTAVADAPGIAIGEFGEVNLVWSSGHQLTETTSTAASCGAVFGSPVLVSTTVDLNTQFDVVTNPATGAVFVVFTELHTVYYAASTGGAFSAAVALTAINTTEFQPDVALSGDGSRVLVSWIRSRDRDFPHLTWYDRVARLGTVSGATLQLGPELATGPAELGGVPEDPRGELGFSSGDAIVTSGASFISLWGEARDASPFHPTQFDVRFARVPVGGGGTADLGVTLTDSADPIAQGDATTLTATVTNASSSTAALLTVLNLDMPPELAASTATTTGGTCYPHPRFLTCQFGRLATGASRTVTINAIAIQPGTVSTTATVTSTATDPNSSDNTATTATTLTAGPTASTSAQNGNYAISDLQTARVPMTVSGTGGRVIDVNVSIRLDHTYDGDLVISLEEPDHTTVTLVGRAGSTGDNFGSGANDCTGTTTNLDDSAGQDYYLASAPFNGTYRPLHPLADLHGVAADGTWTLRVTDAKTGDQGVVGCAKITLTTA